VVERGLEHSGVRLSTRRETNELVKDGRRIAGRGVTEDMVEERPAAGRRVARIRRRGVGVELSVLGIPGRRVRPDAPAVDLLDRRLRK
jgi:hypothetical protein